MIGLQSFPNPILMFPNLFPIPITFLVCHACVPNLCLFVGAPHFCVFFPLLITRKPTKEPYKDFDAPQIKKFLFVGSLYST